MSTLVQALRQCLPPEQVKDDPTTLAEHASDRWHAAAEPEVVVMARNAEDVSTVLRYANEHSIPVTARGAGVGYVGGCVPARKGIALSLAGMDKILEIHAADGVAVVEPGVITGHLQAAVRDQGLFYPPDPASLKECSLGGNVATNAGGPRCLKYGVTRHYVLGLQVVLADGQIMQCGSRCHKNKTGFDLVGLFVGSEGLLGVVTEITLRLLPLPPARALLSASFATYEEANGAVQGILQSGFLPAALEISDQFTLEAARDHVGTELIPDGKAHLLVELDGQESSVAAECESLASLLKSLNALQVDTANGEACEKLWDIRRAFSYSLRATGLIKLNEDIVVPRGRLVDLVGFTERLQKETGFRIASFGHAGDGNIHVNIMVPEMETAAAKKAVHEALDALFEQVLAWGGVISGEHGIGLAKKPWFERAVDPVSHQLHSLLKQTLDPKGILNPGKFVSPVGDND